MEKTTPMTKDEKIIRTKVGLLELVRQLGNVSQACEVMGYSRDSFYRFEELYESGGEMALMDLSKQVPNVKSRLGDEIEKAIVVFALERRHSARRGLPANSKSVASRFLRQACVVSGSDTISIPSKNA